MEGYFNWDVTVQQGCIAEMVGGERPERCFLENRRPGPEYEQLIK